MRVIVFFLLAFRFSTEREMPFIFGVVAFTPCATAGSAEVRRSRTCRLLSASHLTECVPRTAYRIAGCVMLQSCSPRSLFSPRSRQLGAVRRVPHRQAVHIAVHWMLRFMNLDLNRAARCVVLLISKTQWAGGTCYNHLFIVVYIFGWWPTPFRES